MFGPVWMAVAPEVHSALLNCGPGPGPMLAAADAWTALSAAYQATADELTAVLTTVAAGLWQGVAAEQYLAAHQPYLAWLHRSSADSAQLAAGHRTSAAAYGAAQAAMPTLAELAANHAVHAGLVATNFFGINTIPIALNEADYARMWWQAATVMATYQGTCAAVVAAAPAGATPPPIHRPAAGTAADSSENPLQGLLDLLQPILKSLGIQDGVTAHDPMISNGVTTAVAHFLENFGIHWNPAAGTLNGQVYDYYSNAAQPIWYLARSLELFEDFLNVTQDPSRLIPALQYIAALMLFDWPTHIAQFATAVSQSPALFAAAGAVLAPAGALGGLSGLAGLGSPAAAGVPPVPTTPLPAVEIPTAAAGPAVMTPPAGPPTAPPATVPAGASPAAPPSAPAAAPTGPALVPYLIGGGPGIDTGSGLGAHAGIPATATRRTHTPAVDPIAAVTPARRTDRRRRRRSRPGHQDAVLDMTVGVRPDWAPTSASDHGGGELGRAGAVSPDGPRAAGLTARLQLPLLPETWQHR
ncbi:PPE family protein [[Mycobacterium] kokjensenii]|uniref:PPE family protein n=1 Tax=[Mycobacterium] kokjensenii TaxID=3064287 RepID=A0ABM9LHM3_9MYCO|nr:PPE family protein [Mycolicibacter sp. MU0083]CAJ1499171.1 PPE family protein [Mycolicibacter sp. MU0083]